MNIKIHMHTHASYNSKQNNIEHIIFLACGNHSLCNVGGSEAATLLVEAHRLTGVAFNTNLLHAAMYPCAERQFPLYTWLCPISNAIFNRATNPNLAYQIEAASKHHEFQRLFVLQPMLARLCH